MNKKEYIGSMEKLCASREKKNEIWQELSEKCAKRPRLIRRSFIAAAAAVCVLACAVPAAAELVRNYLSNKFPEAAAMHEYVQTSVYTDDDGHVRMTVEELLSDEISVQASILYEALDEQGEEWISTHKFENDMAVDQLMYSTGVGFGIVPNIHPNGGNDSRGHNVSYSSASSEMLEYRTSSSRRFFVQYTATSRDYDCAEAKLVYPMPERSLDVYLDVTSNMEIRTYELNSDIQPYEYCTPVMMQISPLSYTIYGLNNGVFVEYTDEYGWLYFSMITPEEGYPVCRFVMSDGREIELSGVFGYVEPDENNRYCEVILDSNRMPEGVDYNEITGVKIGEVYYYFE